MEHPRPWEQNRAHPGPLTQGSPQTMVFLQHSSTMVGDIDGSKPYLILRFGEALRFAEVMNYYLSFEGLLRRARSGAQ